VHRNTRARKTANRVKRISASYLKPSTNSNQQDHQYPDVGIPFAHRVSDDDSDACPLSGGEDLEDDLKPGQTERYKDGKIHIIEKDDNADVIPEAVVIKNMLRDPRWGDLEKEAEYNVLQIMWKFVG